MTDRSKTTVSPPLQECLDAEAAVLSGYMRTIDGLIAVVIGDPSAQSIRSESTQPPGACVPVLAMMLQAAGSSSHTLLRLSDRPGLQTRDCYSIVRSIVELSANLCYVMTEGEAVAERAMRHARQKSFKDLNPESVIGDSVIKLIFSGQPESASIDGMDADIAEFTSRGDREKGWIDASIDDRIAAVGKINRRAMTALHWARFAVYRHSSEILHGTFFSALFFVGETTPTAKPLSSEARAEAVGQQHMLLLMAAILALKSVVETFHSAYGFASAIKRDSVLMEELRAIPLFRSDKTGRRES